MGDVTWQYGSEKASARLVQSHRADCPSEGPCSTQEPPSSAPSCLMLAGSNLGRPWPQHEPGSAAADGCPPATLLTAGPLKGSAKRHSSTAITAPRNTSASPESQQHRLLLCPSSVSIIAQLPSYLTLLTISINTYLQGDAGDPQL